MRGLLGLLVVCVVVVAVVGFYRGWFSTEVNRDEQKTKIELSVDREKIGEDVKELKRKVGSVGEKE